MKRLSRGVPLLWIFLLMMALLGIGFPVWSQGKQNVPTPKGLAPTHPPSTKKQTVIHLIQKLGFPVGMGIGVGGVGIVGGRIPVGIVNGGGPVQQTNQIYVASEDEGSKKEKLRALTYLLKNHTYDRAAEYFQKLLDDLVKNPTLVKKPKTETYQSFSTLLQRLLIQRGNPAFFQAYQRLYESVAHDQLTQAIQQQNESLLFNLRAHYPFTPSATLAGYILVKRFMENGNLEYALYLLKKVIEEKDRIEVPLQREPLALLYTFLLAKVQKVSPPEILAAWEKSKAPNKTLAVGLHHYSPSQFFELITDPTNHTHSTSLRLPDPGTPVIDDQSPADLAFRYRGVIQTEKTNWCQGAQNNPYSRYGGNMQWAAFRGALPTSSTEQGTLTLFPFFINHHIFFQDGTRLFKANLDSAILDWSTPTWSDTPSTYIPNVLRVDFDGHLAYVNTVEGISIADTSSEGFLRQKIVLSTPQNQNPPNPWGGFAQNGNSFTLSGPPLSQGNTLYAGVVQQTGSDVDYYVYAWDKSKILSGEPPPQSFRWSQHTFLAEVEHTSQGIVYGRSASLASVPILAERDNLLFILTNGGVVAAVNKMDGQILWLTEYGQNSPPSNENAKNPGYLMTYRHYLIAYPSDSNEILLLDQFTGTILKRLKAPQYQEAYSQILGLYGDFLYFITAGNPSTLEIYSFQKDKQQTLQTLDFPLQGRAFMTNQYIYLPVQGGIVRVESKPDTWRMVDDPSHPLPLEDRDPNIAQAPDLSGRVKTVGTLFVYYPYLINFSCESGPEVLEMVPPLPSAGRQQPAVSRSTSSGEKPSPLSPVKTNPHQTSPHPKK